MKKERKAIIVLLIVLALTSILWLPATVMALTDNYDKFQYYVKALEYGLKGLEAYLRFIIELFKTALAT